MFKILPDPLLALIYPRECWVCHNQVVSSDDGVACSDCWGNTRIFNDSQTLCNKCGAFLFAGPPSSDVRCQKCDDHQYDRAFAVGIYEHALSSSVVNLKRIPHIDKRLERLLTATFDRIPANRAETIIPVPLSERRHRERGFNQAELLARAVAKHAGLMVDESSLVRKAHTPIHRAGMDRKARARTVKNAFTVVRPKLIDNRTILLVDDVFTSGETASICAKVLKQSGAATVNVLTIARAL
jgi:ComF family protein